jgi:hypothetical protein
MAEKLLTVRQVQAASGGDHSDGGELMLRVRSVSASWVLRYTAPSGRRREVGLGTARRGNAKECGEGLTAARDGKAGRSPTCRRPRTPARRSPAGQQRRQFPTRRRSRTPATPGDVAAWMHWNSSA